MADFRPPVELRDERAADRDDAAHLRDVASQERSAAAERRDLDADARDTFSAQLAADFHDWLRRLDQDLLDRYTRTANAAIDPDEFPNLCPDELDRLRTHAAEQRRHAEADRAAAVTMIEEIRNQLRHLTGDRRAAANDRHASAQDRADTALDRDAAMLDRDASLQDRSQSAIEREQLDLTDLPTQTDDPPPEIHGLPPEISDQIAHTKATLAASLQKVRETYERLDDLKSVPLEPVADSGH